MDASFLSCALMLLILQNITLSSSKTVGFNLSSDENALLTFKNGITSDPYGVLSSNWSANTSICSWTGISCSLNHHRVTALNLSGLELVGTISPHLGNLTFLQYFDISSNNFTGSIPPELSHLRRLKEINVGSNNLIGEIPRWLGALSQLQHIHLNNNKFSGRIPLSLFNISRLVTLDMAYNLLDGNISELQIADFASLETLNIGSNQLSGQLPADICGGISPKIRKLDLGENQLSGEIPADVYKCRELEKLYLYSNQLSGKIPTGIGNLSMLTRLALFSNHLEGDIPSTIFNISSLEYLDLSNNSLSGSISTFYNSPNLEQLYLGNNNFTGGIPKEIGYLTSLNNLVLSKNHLTGNIPKQLGNLTSLIQLDLAFNKLEGELPEEIGNLAYLEIFGAPFNDFLNGSIPSSIFNISTLKKLGLQQNLFSGSLSPSMGLSLGNLEELYLFYNRLSGEIPSSINNASKLTMLELNRNSFTGSIPDFGNLRLLKALRLWENNLTESPTQELRFLSSLTNCRDLDHLEISDNPLMNGILPTSIGNLSTSLVIFIASNCSIRGVIPSDIGNLSSLQRLDLSENKLTDIIPTSLGELKQLVELYLFNNRLQGYIPSDICQMSNLMQLYLGGNMLSGSVPECLGDIKSLTNISFTSNKLNSTLPSKFLNLDDLIMLDLSSNNFSGQLPDQIGNLRAINELNMSYNNFSGHIPNTISSCKSLVSLSLSNNMLNESIPQSLRELKGLMTLDLSNNHLSGMIPEWLAMLDLQYFNVSYNQLKGEIPDTGSFKNFTAKSFLHNFALCGAARFQVSPCGKSTPKSVSRIILIYIVPSFIAVMILVAGILALIRRHRRRNPPPSTEIPSVGVAWKIISERELKQGTNSFNETTLLGKGGFGSVHKATLADGTNVAVKVFNLELERATKSFATESKILSTIRHRNLLKILGCCSNTEFKALILEYMPNGSLEKWLHSDIYCLDLVQRVKIAIDVALALKHLHHDHTYTVVHCDIKPSNVLLDADMTAHVGDFGIAKLFDSDDVAVFTRNMATTGYAAPEFGSDGKVSTGGDVYSYGILLLEMFTSKKPTDDMFDAEMSLKEWVDKALQENAISKIVAPCLLSREDRHFSSNLQSVSSIIDLAMNCLAFSPDDRTNMIQVVAALQKIKAKLPVQEVKKKPRR